MLVIFARAPQQDAVVWPGRRVLAFLDAVTWPAAWTLFILGLPTTVGLAGQVTLAMCAVAALVRAHRACVRNPRYRFTTWRWLPVLSLLIVFDLVFALAGRLAP